MAFAPSPLAGKISVRAATVRERKEGRLLLVSTAAVPADADLLPVPSGNKAPLREEQAVITRYARSGGKVLFWLISE